MKHLNAEQQRWLMRIILKGKPLGYATRVFKLPPQRPLTQLNTKKLAPG
jgi:hypothetical protein